MNERIPPPTVAASSATTMLEYLSALFPACISVQELSSITSERQQTIRNRLSAGQYPIPSFNPIGTRRRLFRLVDVAAYIDRSLALSHVSTGKRRGRGRPTKLEMMLRSNSTK